MLRACDILSSDLQPSRRPLVSLYWTTCPAPSDTTTTSTTYLDYPLLESPVYYHDNASSVDFPLSAEQHKCLLQRQRSEQQRCQYNGLVPLESTPQRDSSLATNIHPASGQQHFQQIAKQTLLQRCACRVRRARNPQARKPRCKAVDAAQHGYVSDRARSS